MHMRTTAQNLLCYLLGVFALLAAQVCADPAAYQIEVIVFERNTPDATAGRASAPSGAAPSGAAVSPLPPAQLLLTGAAQQLKTSGRYRPLLHIGWRQGAGDGRAIRISSSEKSVDGWPIVDGDVRLRIGKQLGLAVELQCRYNGQVMALRDNRNLRIGELHYVDHPIFGMLVQVTRVAGTPE